MSNLITENSNLIWSIVSRFKDRGYDIEDLYQIGCIGFIKSIKRFDSNYDVKLSTYAVPYILGEIKRFIRDDGPVKVSRSIKELSYKIKIVQSEFVNKKGREAKIEELSKVLKVGKDEILIAIDSSNSVESIDRNISDSDDLTIMDKLKSNIDGYLARLGVQLVETYIVAVFGREIDVTVGIRPVHTFHAGVEVLGQGRDVFGDEVEEE